MGKGIIAMLLAIPTFIVTVYIMIVQFWAEGQVTEALMNAFGVNPVIVGLITVAGIIVFVIVLLKATSSSFGL